MTEWRDIVNIVVEHIKDNSRSEGTSPVVPG
jgi:hypothetical protein